MNPKLIFKPFYTSLKLLLLLSIFFGISNCKRDIDGPCDKSNIYYDTSYFEKNERDLLPDWEGDSLFFYSDAGDTAYLFCKSQYLGITYDYPGRNGSTWCSWTETYPYESFGATYSSNNSELNNISIQIYKESYSKYDQSNPPFRQAKIDISKYGIYDLLIFDGKIQPDDSVLLTNGKYEVGILDDDSKIIRTTMNLNVGLMIMETKNVKKWTLFRYTLVN